MKLARSSTGVLSVLAVGLIFASATLAQMPGSKSDLKVSGSADTQVCVYNISGKGDMAGMLCGGCTNRVRTALKGVDGVLSVEAVDLRTQTATVIISKDSEAGERIPAAVEEVGFIAALATEEVDPQKVTPDN